MTADKQHIVCRKIDGSDINDWKTAGKVFANAQFAQLVQAWLKKPEERFRPAKAAAAWTQDALIVYAELEDEDIFNEAPESDFNRKAYELGDVFEIFLKPSGQDSYCEFHINPNNQKFQLRFPRQGWKTPDNDADEFRIPERTLESRVEVKSGSWRVLARIPFKMLVENQMPPKPGDKWLYSFSRYDYTRPGKTPTLSSSSAHLTMRPLCFHAHGEYGTLEFSR
jgi:hypothetical protein